MTVTRALLEQRLVGITLPATKDLVLAWAAASDASDAELAALDRLEERTYTSANEVGEALFPVDPAPLVERAHAGSTQSGAPPGGRDYVAKADK